MNWRRNVGLGCILAALLGTGCSGNKKTETSTQTAASSQAAPPASKAGEPSSAAKAPAGKEPAKKSGQAGAAKADTGGKSVAQTRRERLAKAFEQAYCAVFTGTSDPTAAYTAAGFKTPDAWRRAWLAQADADPKWAMKTVGDVVAHACGQSKAAGKSTKKAKKRRR